MIRRKDGFTLIEIIVTMAIFTLVIVAAASMFVGLIGQFKQQSKIAETNIEGLVGLEMLRNDIAQAGYGLPWFVDVNNNNVDDWTLLANYNEATDPDGTAYNDGSPASNLPAPANVVRAPRAIVTGIMNTGWTTSTRIVIKSVNIAANAASQRWTYISNSGPLPNFLRQWTTISNERVAPTDNIIVVNPEVRQRQRVLRTTQTGTFFTKLNNTDFSFVSGGWGTCSFEPQGGSYSAYMAYGINDGSVNPRGPFNRADYYVKQPTTGMPSRCAPSTGILYKATLNYANGLFTEMPLVDCVEYMRTVFRMNNAYTEDISTYTAEQIRNRLQEIRIYIIAHEGQVDRSYTSWSTVSIDANWPQMYTIPASERNYRWKLYTLVIMPYSLR